MVAAYHPARDMGLRVGAFAGYGGYMTNGDWDLGGTVCCRPSCPRLGGCARLLRWEHERGPVARDSEG